jgi:hypothetical protein
MRPLIVGLVFLGGCLLEGPEGFFVQLYGRVTTEHDEPASGMLVSFASDHGALIHQARTDAEGWYSAMVLASALEDHALQLRVEGEGWTTTQAWVELQLTEGEPSTLNAHPPQLWSSWSRQLPPLQVAEEAASGQASLAVVDASTGEPPVEDYGGQIIPLRMQLELREGWNAPDSDAVVATFASGEGALEGRFEIDGVPPGVYTGRIPGTGGYTASRLPLLVRAASEKEQRASVTRALASTEIRAALVWGEAPADLNLHVTGPRASVSTGESEWERFHVWAEEPEHPPAATDPEDLVVTMDLTAEEGLGPETVSVHELRSLGEYRFSVVEHGGEIDSDHLGWSGALLQLWIGTREPLFFEPTPGQEGNLWNAAVWDSDLDRTYRLQEPGSTEDEFDSLAF